MNAIQRVDVVYDVAVYWRWNGVSGGLLISAVMLTGGTSKYGPPPAPEVADRCLSSLSPWLVVTNISGLALGVNVQSRTPTVTCSTAASVPLSAASVTFSGSRAWCGCCCTRAVIAAPPPSESRSLSFAGRPATVHAACADGCRRDALNSRLTASKTRATRSGWSYGSRTTGNTGLGIKRRRHTSGDGRNWWRRRCCKWRTSDDCSRPEDCCSLSGSGGRFPVFLPAVMGCRHSPSDCFTACPDVVDHAPSVIIT